MKRKYERASVIWLNESDKLESNVIYLLTFNDNEREMYYVGKTTTQLRERLYSHSIIRLNPTILIQQAINRLKSFTVSILCKCSSIDELKTKEIFYTLLYKSSDRYFGYNVQVGSNWLNSEKIKLAEYYKTHPEACDRMSKILIEYYKTHDNPMLGRKQSKKCIETNSIKCKSIPDNIIFNSIKQCQVYYISLYGRFDILFYLDKNKIHKKSGQTFVRIKD